MANTKPYISSGKGWDPVKKILDEKGGKSLDSSGMGSHYNWKGKQVKKKKKTGPNQVASHTNEELRRARTGSSGHKQYPT